MTRFWRWLARFAYRRVIARVGPDQALWGIPGKRDVDNLCMFYSPYPMRLIRHGDGHPWMVAGCMGDGHALCKECVWLESHKKDWTK